jgi:hypothetical protein
MTAPEATGHQLSNLRTTGMQQEVREELLHLEDVETVEVSAVPSDAKLAEEGDLEVGHAGRSAGRVVIGGCSRVERPRPRTVTTPHQSSRQNGGRSLGKAPHRVRDVERSS